MRLASLVLLAGLTQVGSADAQDGKDEITDFTSQVPDAQDRRWQRAVAGALKVPRGKLWRARFTWRPMKGSNKRPTLKIRRALQLKLARIDARRLWFADEAAALNYAGRANAKRTKQYVVIEVRGRQAVVLAGPGVQTHESAAQALKALWVGPFPAPKRRSLIAVRYDDGHFAAWTVPRGSFHESTVNAFKKAHARKAALTKPGPLQAQFKGKHTVIVTAKDLTAVMTVTKTHSRTAVGVGPTHALRSFRVDEFLTALEFYVPQPKGPASRPASRPKRKRSPRRVR